jgi:WD40 repeat protein
MRNMKIAFWVNNRILNIFLAVFCIFLGGSILLAECNKPARTPSALGTPIPTNLSIIARENIDKLTELAYWPVEGWVKSCILFSPDGRFLAFAYNENNTAIQVRDVATGYSVETLAGITGRVDSLAFSPDGKSLASSVFDKKVIIWNVKNGQELQTLTFPNATFGLAFSPDGKLLTVGLKNGTIQLLNVNSNQIVQTFSGHTDLVNSVVFSPDGRKIASGSFDDLIILWDIEGGEIIRSFKGHSDSVWRVAFSPDGKTLASASTDGTVRLWNVATGQEILILKGDTVLEEWYDVEFSIDGTYLVAASRHTLAFWDVSDGSKIRTIEKLETGIDTISFSPDGKLLATGGDGIVQLWGVR